eukprot:m.193201 g.193201  ORF g.193201 m.193201 type:complete len:95 (+) comp10603_c2_seq15:684-968(+)
MLVSPSAAARLCGLQVFCPLGPDLLPRGPLQAWPARLPWTRVIANANDREIGPEDPRVFRWGNEHFMAFNDLPHESSNKLIRCMKIQVACLLVV